MTGAVEITFRQMTPTDELVYFVRRACERVERASGERACWHVLIDRDVDRGQTRVRVARGGQQALPEVEEMDPDPFLAARNAFVRLATAADHVEPTPVESGVFSMDGQPLSAARHS